MAHRRIGVGLACGIAVLMAGLAFLARGPEARKHDPSERSAPSAKTPAAGRLLVANRKLSAPFFAESVVLLLEYSPEGALGLVVNRPTSTLLSDIVPEVARLSPRQDRVYIGGPVEPGVMTFLIRSQKAIPDAVEVVSGVYATGSPATLRQVIQSPTLSSHFHAFVGYSGWAPGQLDNEIARGDWHVGRGGATTIFDDAPDDLWQRTIFEFEGVQVRRGPGLGALALR